MRKALIVFGTLSDGDIDWLIKVGKLRRFSPAEPIISEGQPIDALYIILDGRAIVLVEGNQIARAFTGELLGEVSLVHSRLPTASVVAEQETTVLEISRSVLSRKLREDMGFGSRFYHSIAILLAQRLQRNTLNLAIMDAVETEEKDLRDDIDPTLLETVSSAGVRFDQLLRRTLRND